MATARHHPVARVSRVVVLVTIVVAAPLWAAQDPTPSIPPKPAPSPEPPRDEDLEFEEEVVVTATRANRRLQDEPLRVEVIGREEIEEKALMTPGSVAMLLGETTGLRIQTTAPSMGAANVRIQGLRGRYAQLLADGLPLYGAAGDSFSLLQVPPLDLEQVEVIKGAASALYGPSALGGVINLVSRRPREAERQALVNVTSQAGLDVTGWLAGIPTRGRSWTLLGGYHRQGRQDLDEDGWTDLAGFDRGVVRPRFFYDSGEGRTLFVTGGLIAEQRRGGTLPGGAGPDGLPFDEALDALRGDLGAAWQWLTPGDTLAAARGSLSRLQQNRVSGLTNEHGVRTTGFSEASLAGSRGAHTWVVGGTVSLDAYDARELDRFDYTFAAPAVFVQDEIVLGSSMSFALSARLDLHSEYGALFSPRVSSLVRPGGSWTVRLSAGLGAFAPTPFTEETDATGLARVETLTELDAERAVSASADVSWTSGPIEVTGTVFGSRVSHPVQLIDTGPASVAFVNMSQPTNTWGTELLFRYRRGRILAMLSHAFTQSREQDPSSVNGVRRQVPLTAGHAASFNVMWEAGRSRAGFESYFTGLQSLEDNPYRTNSRRYVLFGGLIERRIGRARLFLNVENLADIRQTKYDPLVQPDRLPDGRWTVDAWAPLDGRVWNGGIRVDF